MLACVRDEYLWSDNITGKVGDSFENNLDVKKDTSKVSIPKHLRHVGGDFPIYKFNTGSAIFIAIGAQWII